MYVCRGKDATEFFIELHRPEILDEIGQYIHAANPCRSLSPQLDWMEMLIQYCGGAAAEYKIGVLAGSGGGGGEAAGGGGGGGAAAGGGGSAAGGFAAAAGDGDGYTMADVEVSSSSSSSLNVQLSER